MKTSFRRNIVIGFGVSLLLLLISSAASFVSIRLLLDNFGRVTHTHEVLNVLEKLNRKLVEAETSLRGFALTQDATFLTSYTEDSTEVKALLRDFASRTSDNYAQIRNLDSLTKLVDKRLTYLSGGMLILSGDQPITKEQWLSGKNLMSKTTDLIRLMEEIEQNLLLQRSTMAGRFSQFTPMLIVCAAIISILLTTVFYLRVMSDLRKRVRLQEELIKKDREISERIRIIKEIADKISGGNYQIRLDDEGKDLLGNLAGSLNKMAESLNYSFGVLSDKEWLQAGIAGLTIRMQGEKSLKLLCSDILDFAVATTGSQVGAFYLLNDNHLDLINTFGLEDGVQKKIKLGQGIVGQVAADKKLIHFEGLNDENFMISLASGMIKPKGVIVFPVIHENKVLGVIELGCLDGYHRNHLHFIQSIEQQIGIVINSTGNRQRLQELLEETQAQSEELQTQHSELENVNEELRLQSQKLQVSEEELKVQQEELMQSNTELEERTNMLEEKNSLIEERNQEIQEKARELDISMRYKSEFLANMSHELRTPLNSILLLSRLMYENNEENLTPDQVEFAKVIQTSGQALLSLIDEILDLSKIESGKMQIEVGETSLREIGNDINSLFYPIAKEKNIEFNIEFDSDVPAVVETDKARLEQIIKNLVSNAIKFTSQGEVKMRIRRDPDRNEFMVFDVVDTGIGIPEDKHQLIFEAFQQADGSTRRQYGGTGLGLSISRELARLLGGSIELKSSQGEGSTFSLRIPLQNDPGLASEDLPVTGQQNGEAGTAKNGVEVLVTGHSVPDDRQLVRTADKTILIIEDDVPFAITLLEFSRRKGYKGIVALRGDEGLELARKYRPTGILLDVNLPVKNGWEVMKELKENSRTRNIPVHVMSSTELGKQSLRNGAMDFINKPVAFEKMGEVFQNIEMILKREPRKVLIVEENPKHAEALSFFLENFQVKSIIRNNVREGIASLLEKDVHCVILDMGIAYQKSYDILEEVKKTPGLEKLPIIIFTGKHLSKAEEIRIRQYADSIVVKTAHSYQRILDEVSLFLHLMEEQPDTAGGSFKKLGRLGEVLAGKKVLIADDDVRNIFSLSRALENFEMKVYSATDGREALQQLSENPEINIVLMDMMMPEMDGYESMKEIRKIPRFQKIPIIAVTAKAMAGDREKCIRSGASDYITKPVDTDQLLSLLRVWLYEQA